MSVLVRNLIVTILIFVIVAVGITLVMIVKENNSYTKINSDIKTIEKGIDLYGTYNENDLIIDKIPTVYGGYEVEIPKINGLKDKTVEEKINNDMKLRIFEIIKKLNVAEGSSLTTNVYAQGNFANIISLSYYISDDETFSSDSIYLNYNLVTGDKLNFEDIFKKDANLLDIVRNAYYKELSKYYSLTYDEQYFDDNELVKKVNTFLNDENKKFYVTPSSVSIYSDNYYAGIKFIEIADQVVIYNKYLTEQSIFERDDIGFKGIFTCADAYYDNFGSIEYGLVEDNLWYDITTMGNSYFESKLSGDILEKINDLKQTNLQDIKTKLENYKNIAKNNKDKFYIFVSKPSVSIYNKSYFDNEANELMYKFADLSNVNNKVEIYEMDKSTYENKYKDKIIIAYRDEFFTMHDGFSISIESGDNVNYTTEENSKTINLKTNEEIKSLQDVFYEDSGYMDIIEDKIKEKLYQKSIYEPESDRLLKEAEYSVNAFYISVTFPSLKDFEMSIVYDAFDDSMFKHWL